MSLLSKLTEAQDTAQNPYPSEYEKLRFPALKMNEENFFQWSADLYLHAESKKVEKALEVVNNKRDPQYDTSRVNRCDAATAIIMIRHHLCPSLRIQYMDERDPAKLYAELKTRFERIKEMVLPQARSEWHNLRVQDFVSFTEFNHKLNEISTWLKRCGEQINDKDKIEKTLSTMSPAHLLLTHQYRAMKFKTYIDLATYLSVAEQNDRVLLKNSERPPGAIPMPESSMTQVKSKKEMGKPKRHKYKWSKVRSNLTKSGTYAQKYQTKRAFKHNNICFRCNKPGHFAINCKTKNIGNQKDTLESDAVDISTIEINSPLVLPKLAVNETTHTNDNSDYCIELDYGTDPGEVSDIDIFMIGTDTKGVEGILIDSGATHSILKDRYLFTSDIKPLPCNKIKTITGSQTIQASVGKAKIKLQSGTEIEIEEAIFCPTATRNLLSFRDIHKAGYTVWSAMINDHVVLQLKNSSGTIKEIIPAYSSGLFICPFYSHENYNTNYTDDIFRLWHNRLGHPGTSMIKRIITNTVGHNFKNKEVPNKDGQCDSCALGKFIRKPSQYKLKYEGLQFLERLQGDICGPINPPCGPFRYFLVLVDASTKFSQVVLLASRNQAFAKLLGMIIAFKAQYPDHPIKVLRLDGAGEFTSKSFIAYCNSIGINLQYSVPHVHTQNGLAESFIKRIRLIAVPILMKSNLPINAWGHAILHSAKLIQIRPSGLEQLSPIELVTGNKPQISHLRIFGCKVLVPIPPYQKTKIGPQRKEGIYVGYDSPSIIKYIEPKTGNLFRARFKDCYFDENIFPTLMGTKKNNQEELLTFDDSKTLLKWPDFRTQESENEVRRILNLRQIANELPDSFNNTMRVTKSHIPVENAPITTPINNIISAKESVELKLSNKRQADQLNETKKKVGRPKKVKTSNKSIIPVENTIGSSSNPPLISIQDNDIDTQEENHSLSERETDNILNKEIDQINTGVYKGTRSNIENIPDDIFAYHIANEINTQDDPDPFTIEEARKSLDWLQWKEAIKQELQALTKRNVLGPIIDTPKNIQPIGCRWVFVKKRNSENQIIRYKARLVAQGYSQKPGIDYVETYSPVIDATTFRYLISIAVNYNLVIRLLDVVTAYLYGNLDTDIYMKVPRGMLDKKQEGTLNNKSVKLQRALYGLKQAGRMWYERLSRYLIGQGYKSSELCPCIFIKKNIYGLIIIAVYVDDLNIIGTEDAIEYTVIELKREFEMKDLGKTTFCIGQQIEYIKGGVFIHQTTYTRKVLKKFRYDAAYPVSSPMVVRSLEPDNDPFRPKGEEEKGLEPNVPYLSAIGALMYLANNTRPDIAFAVNLLARYSAAPTQRHWVGIKQVFRYLRGTEDYGLFYQSNSNSNIIGYADAGFLSDPHKGRSQTGYIFMRQGAAISWKSAKQTLVATSSTHTEMIALYEASRECVWLRSINKYILETSELSNGKIAPTVIYEDNTPCITQVSAGYIKGKNTKHIIPKYYYIHELLGSEIEIRKVKTHDNLADLFTKALPSSTHRKLTRAIGMRALSLLV